MTFEEQVRRLEEILQIIEEGKVSLDEINTLFAEGVNLAKSCFDMLEQSKGKITILKADLEKLIEQPFE